jgi:hypothetical protein
MVAVGALRNMPKCGYRNVEVSNVVYTKADGCLLAGRDQAYLQPVKN